MEKVFEIIDQYGGRHRFATDKYYSEWRLKPGPIDIEGSEFLDVRACDDDAIICTIPNPAIVGVVTDETALVMMPRELQLEQCPRCGWVKDGK